ncbi:MAG: hypothetical protein ACR2K9_01090 [Solirubrobacteraceae bacterium]
MPQDSLLEFTRRRSSDVVVLSIKQPELAGVLAVEVTALSDRGGRHLVVAGDGVPESLRREKDSVYAAGVEQIVAAVESLL